MPYFRCNPCDWESGELRGSICDNCGVGALQDYGGAMHCKYCGYFFGRMDCPICERTLKLKGAHNCYLTSACLQALQESFDDNCRELIVLRHFRDTYVKEHHPDDIKHYYDTAPGIVTAIKNSNESNNVFRRIYDELVMPTFVLINKNENEAAYELYKNYSLNLENQYLIKV
ncbi:MAG: hypothetical protein LBS74_08480 [Oscillospiraceae bacterium]|nr:hypothetical protein [Oscillospiraceae bacterium]